MSELKNGYYLAKISLVGNDYYTFDKAYFHNGNWSFSAPYNNNPTAKIVEVWNIPAPGSGIYEAR